MRRNHEPLHEEIRFWFFFPAMLQDQCLNSIAMTCNNNKEEGHKTHNT